MKYFPRVCSLNRESEVLVSRGWKNTLHCSEIIFMIHAYAYIPEQEPEATMLFLQPQMSLRISQVSHFLGLFYFHLSSSSFTCTILGNFLLEWCSASSIASTTFIMHQMQYKCVHVSEWSIETTIDWCPTAAIINFNLLPVLCSNFIFWLSSVVTTTFGPISFQHHHQLHIFFSPMKSAAVAWFLCSNSLSLHCQYLVSWVFQWGPQFSASLYSNVVTSYLAFGFSMLSPTVPSTLSSNAVTIIFSLLVIKYGPQQPWPPLPTLFDVLAWAPATLPLEQLHVQSNWCNPALAILKNRQISQLASCIPDVIFKQMTTTFIAYV